MIATVLGLVCCFQLAPADTAGSKEVDLAKNLIKKVEELRELGRFDEMVKTILQLVDALPEAAEAGRALMILGDYAFDQNKMPDAKITYQRVLKGPYSADVKDWALFKLGWVLINEIGKESDRKAWEAPLGKFEQIIRSRRMASSYPSDKTRIDLRQEALLGLVFCYSEARPDGKLLSYIEGLALSPEETRLVLEKAANRTFIKGRFSTARVLYRKLLTLVSDPEEAADFRERLQDVEELLSRQH
jgi:tetratricopeptide (TPR) repeat protein